MKKALFLCAVMGAVLVLGGCETPSTTTTTTTTETSRQGLVGPGSVAPVSGGPSRAANKPRVEP